MAPTRCPSSIGAGVMLWRVLSIAFLSSVLFGCSVLTIDVDVYKGPLANERSVQKEQAAALAIGARPLLIELRDRLVFDKEDERHQWRTTRQTNGELTVEIVASHVPVYNSGSIAMWLEREGDRIDGPGPRLKNEFAQKVDAVLGLYEDRNEQDSVGFVQIRRMERLVSALTRDFALAIPSADDSNEIRREWDAYVAEYQSAYPVSCPPRRNGSQPADPGVECLRVLVELRETLCGQPKTLSTWLGMQALDYAIGSLCAQLRAQVVLSSVFVPRDSAGLDRLREERWGPIEGLCRRGMRACDSQAESVASASGKGRGQPPSTGQFFGYRRDVEALELLRRSPILEKNGLDNRTLSNDSFLVRYQALSRPGFVRDLAEAAFPGDDFAAQRDQIVDHLTGAALAYLSATLHTRELLETALEYMIREFAPENDRKPNLEILLTMSEFVASLLYFKEAKRFWDHDSLSEKQRAGLREIFRSSEASWSVVSMRDDTREALLEQPYVIAGALHAAHRAALRSGAVGSRGRIVGIAITPDELVKESIAETYVDQLAGAVRTVERSAIQTGFEDARPEKGLASLVQEYVDAHQNTLSDPEDDADAWRRLEPSLISFAEKLLTLANYGPLVGGEKSDGDDSEVDNYTQVLQTVGNTILTQLNELRAHEAWDERSKRTSVELAALQSSVERAVDLPGVLDGFVAGVGGQSQDTKKLAADLEEYATDVATAQNAVDAAEDADGIRSELAKIDGDKAPASLTDARREARLKWESALADKKVLDEQKSEIDKALKALRDAAEDASDDQEDRQKVLAELQARLKALRQVILDDARKRTGAMRLSQAVVETYDVEVVKKAPEGKEKTAREAEAALLRPLAAGLRVASYSAPSDPENRAEVIDSLIAQLEYDKVLAEAAGQTTTAQQLDAALKSAMWMRASEVYIRPASFYLRNSTPATGLQLSNRIGYRNELHTSGLSFLPFGWGEHARNSRDLGDSAGGSVRSRLEDQSALDAVFWQNINRIRVSGGGNANYAVTKDDVGNWYVKSYSTDVEQIIESAKNLAMFGLSQSGAISSGALGSLVPQTEGEGQGVGEGQGSTPASHGESAAKRVANSLDDAYAQARFKEFDRISMTAAGLPSRLADALGIEGEQSPTSMQALRDSIMTKKPGDSKKPEEYTPQEQMYALAESGVPDVPGTVAKRRAELSGSSSSGRSNLDAQYDPVAALRTLVRYRHTVSLAIETHFANASDEDGQPNRTARDAAPKLRRVADEIFRNAIRQHLESLNSSIGAYSEAAAALSK
ncbi:MAG: hypothetical protein AAGG07_06115 [Planctomycetota bacterium]